MSNAFGDRSLENMKLPDVFLGGPFGVCSFENTTLLWCTGCFLPRRLRGVREGARAGPLLFERVLGTGDAVHALAARGACGGLRCRGSCRALSAGERLGGVRGRNSKGGFLAHGLYTYYLICSDGAFYKHHIYTTFAPETSSRAPRSPRRPLLQVGATGAVLLKCACEARGNRGDRGSLGSRVARPPDASARTRGDLASGRCAAAPSGNRLRFSRASGRAETLRPNAAGGRQRVDGLLYRRLILGICASALLV